MPQIFTVSANERLEKYLRKTNEFKDFEQLTPDASTREFFRVKNENRTAIACIYPEKFDENLPQIDVTNLFIKANLPVAAIYEADYESGIVLHEDFGDTILRDVLNCSSIPEREKFLSVAITLIAEIQAATKIAFQIDSIASKLVFDEEKLFWELSFFKEHFFKSLKKIELSETDDENLTLEFTELARELESYAKVLTHRDFHAANLMLDDNKNLKIIDHQDARIGSVVYDLVSLLLDRVTEIPTQEWLEGKKKYFLNEREKLGLDSLKLNEFNYEFDLTTIQRCLKAIGTFSNQAANFRKTDYVQYINPMFEIVLNACRRLQRFPNLQRIIENNLTGKNDETDIYKQIKG